MWMYFLDVFDTPTSVRQINRIRRALEQKAPARSTLDITVKKKLVPRARSKRAGGSSQEPRSRTRASSSQ